MKIYSAVYREFSPLDSFYPEFECIQLKDGDATITGPGILVIWGGGDIHPSLYNRPNQGSQVGNAPSMRDMTEAKLFAKAVDAGVFILGVCRGAQLGCAMSGGFLVQDVDGHGWSHRVTAYNGDTFMASSLHHQMMYPWDVDHKLLAWSTQPRSPDYKGISDDEWKKWPRRMYEELKSDDVIEPEIVFFPKTNCLAVQGHPEMMAPNCAHNQFVKKCIDELYLHTT